MNPLLRLLLLLAAVGGAGGFALTQYLHQKTEMEARLDLARIERTMDQRLAGARVVSSANDYGDEMRGLMKWYFSEVRSHDNRYPEFKDHDRHWEEIEHRHATGKYKEPEFAAFKANHDEVAAIYKSLSSGDYTPMFSATSAGQHFDIWRMEKVTQDGKPKVRLDFAWWGVQSRDEVEERADSTSRVHHKQVSATVNAFDITLMGDAPDPKAKVKNGEKPVAFRGELHAAEPEMKIPDPDTYTDLFPANVELGAYWMDLLPHEATKMHVEFATETRTVQGHDLPAKFGWDIPLSEEWKLGEGQTWEGATVETREADEGGPEANADAPAPAKKARHH